VLAKDLWEVQQNKGNLRLVPRSLVDSVGQIIQSWRGMRRGVSVSCATNSVGAEWVRLPSLASISVQPNERGRGIITLVETMQHAAAGKLTW